MILNKRNFLKYLCLIKISIEMFKITLVFELYLSIFFNKKLNNLNFNNFNIYFVVENLKTLTQGSPCIKY